MLSRARSAIAAVTATAMLSATSVAAVPTAHAAGQNSYNGVPVVQIDSKRGDWNKNRNWKRRHSKNRHRGHHHHHRNDGAGIALGIFGFAAGAMLGSALSQPSYRGTSVDAYCSRKYKTYKPWTGTYTGYDGREHPCRYP